MTIQDLQTSISGSVSSYETADWPLVEFPSSTTAGAVEACLQEFHAIHGTEPARVCLDFSKSTFIEIAALQIAIAYCASRTSVSLPIKIRLPEGDGRVNARHFLRRWEFDEALKAATGMLFRSMVDRHDLRYFAGVPGGGDVGDPYARIEVRYDSRSGEIVYGREAYRFFKFMSWKLNSHTNKAAIIENERTRWRDVDQIITETLRKSLRVRLKEESDTSTAVETDKFLVARVMFQAMTNALRHPDASVLQASSHMSHLLASDPKNPERKRIVDNVFTLVYWDDGQPMYETLSAAIEKRNPVHFPSEARARYLIQLNDENDLPAPPRIVESSEIPHSNSTQEELFYSTLFPGVSCDVQGRNRISYPRSERIDRLLELPGHGLFVLVQAVTELMDGSVSFRSGDLFMNVTGMSRSVWSRTGLAGECPNYRIKVRRMPHTLPKFRGNMITIRLKLTPAEI